MKGQQTLSDDQRKVLEMDRNHPKATPKDIHGMLDDPEISIGYVKHVIESDDFQLPEQRRENQHKISILNATSSGGENDEGGAEDSESGADEQPTPAEPRSNHRPLDTLGDKGKHVIENVRENPDATSDEIGEMSDSTWTHVRRTIVKFSHLIPEDAAVWEDIERPELTTSADEIASSKKREIVEAIIDNPTASKKEITEIAETNLGYITDTMQMYQHILPDEWCERFPSLTNGDTLPRGHGDDASRGGRESETSAGTTVSPETATSTADEMREEVGLDTADAEEPGAGENTTTTTTSPEIGKLQPHDDIDKERERLRNLNNIGLLADEGLDKRLNQLDILEGTEGADTDSDTTPEPQEEEADEDVQVDDENETVSVSASDRDHLESEIELLRDSQNELATYAKGIQHALTVLGVDTH